MAQIKLMTEAEVDQVAEIAAEVFSHPWTRQGFSEALPGEDNCFLLCMEGDRVLGYCGLYMAADEGEIINVAVKPEYQGQGIANQLMQALLEAGESRGVSRFFLEVRVSNVPAIGLYEKHGFVKQGIRKNFYDAPKEDAFVMNRIRE
ncbi:MAG: ribosomal protein S18-alanine N-acetyltransferase [Lachnospiraceae bacterium]|nr:ribosomal protein S18-alanine N-acetyltransferase [Lachnospiraceae bacterium]